MNLSNHMGAVANREGLDSQALLSGVAEAWRRAGIRVVGMLAENGDVDGPCSAGFLCDIASGRRYSIHLDAPPSGTSCHLDAAGVDEAGAGLLARIASAEIVILSKFGKLEGMRQGLWLAFTAASAAGKPLLTTVSPKHVEAWTAFAPGAAWLDAEHASIEQWWRTVKRAPAEG